MPNKKYVVINNLAYKTYLTPKSFKFKFWKIYLSFLDFTNKKIKKDI